MTDELITFKKHRRHLERVYASSHTTQDFSLLRTATNRYHKLITHAKRLYNSNLVQSTISNPRLLWKTINSILHRKPSRALPSTIPFSTIPQVFADFFSDKVSKLHLNLLSNPSPLPAHSPPPTTPLLLQSLSPTTLSEITT